MSEPDGRARPRARPTGVGVEDLCDLDFCSEDAVLEVLQKRYAAFLPYTGLGKTLTVAMNPHEWLNLYTDADKADYLDRDPYKLPPHVYAASARAHRALAAGCRDQSILISGMSGSGKTETAKLLLAHLASCDGGAGGSAAGTGASADYKVGAGLAAAAATERARLTVQCTAVLESFGNAVVVGNSNSSRFGAVMDLQFDGGSRPRLVGSQARTYLLEKSRVVRRGPAERNFHVLYQMLAAGDEKLLEKLHLQGRSADSFAYLASEADASPLDATGIEEVRRAFRALRVTEEEESDIFCVLAGVLHLGQVSFVAAEGRDDDACTITSGSGSGGAVATVAALFGVGVSDLEKALLSRPIHIRGETFVKPNKAWEATDARDAIAKGVYLGAFNYLLRRINEATRAASDGPGASVAGVVSVVDIFGFESLAKNGFEQFLINYASEKLQQKLVRDVFKDMEALCRSEGVAWEAVEYVDNTAVLTMIENPRDGVIALLDEECLLPHATGGGFVALLEQEACPRHGERLWTDTQNHAFGVHHYARPATYDTAGFIDNNRDRLHPSVTSLLAKGDSSKLLKEIYKYAAAAEAAQGIGGDDGDAAAGGEEFGFKKLLAGFKNRETARDGGAAPLPPVPGGRRGSSIGGGVAPPSLPSRHGRGGSIGGGGGTADGAVAPAVAGGRRTVPTVASTFRQELRDLVERVNDTDVQYVCCILPDEAGRPREFNRSFVASQLRWGSVVEAAEVFKRIGHHSTHEAFIERYSVLGPLSLAATGGDVAEIAVRCGALAGNLMCFLSRYYDDPDPFVVGRTRIFLRPYAHRHVLDVLAFYMRVRARRLLRVAGHWRAFARAAPERRRAAEAAAAAALAAAVAVKARADAQAEKDRQRRRE
ncbi:unnamed protein product, partial [Phaeothamnion confervicola]